MTGDMAKKYYNSFRITHDAYQKWYDSLPKATEGLDDLNQKTGIKQGFSNVSFNEKTKNIIDIKNVADYIRYKRTWSKYTTTWS